MVYCTLRKAAAGIPFIFNIALITYISYTFQVLFLPEWNKLASFKSSYL